MNETNDERRERFERENARRRTIVESRERRAIATYDDDVSRTYRIANARDDRARTFVRYANTSIVVDRDVESTRTT